MRLRAYLSYAIGVLVVIYLVTSLFQTIRKNYELNQQIGALEEETELLRIEEEELRYRIEYYKTEAFKEKEARAKLGLQLPGEEVIILPPADDGNKAKPPVRKTNWQLWREFLFG